jgi:hypothetical protein
MFASVRALRINGVKLLPGLLLHRRTVITCAAPQSLTLAAGKAPAVLRPTAAQFCYQSAAMGRQKKAVVKTETETATVLITKGKKAGATVGVLTHCAVNCHSIRHLAGVPTSVTLLCESLQ